MQRGEGLNPISLDRQSDGNSEAQKADDSNRLKSFCDHPVGYGSTLFGSVGRAMTDGVLIAHPEPFLT